MSDHRVNERIRAREVRLIDPDGKQLGVKPLPEALAVAKQLDLDLVEVAPDASPPVCRIMDYNRFKYETAQRAKESKKKATNTSIKEMKYRPKIGTGDFSTKTRQVRGFLEEGHKVKVTIMFRGREVSHPELGMKILEDLAEQVAPVAKVEMSPKLDGRNMTMVLAPDRRARQAAARRTGPSPDGQVPAEEGSADGTPTASATATGAPATVPAAPEAPAAAASAAAAPETPAVVPAALDAAAPPGAPGAAAAQADPAQASPAQATPAAADPDGAAQRPGGRGSAGRPAQDGSSPAGASLAEPVDGAHEAGAPAVAGSTSR